MSVRRGGGAGSVWGGVRAGEGGSSSAVERHRAADRGARSDRGWPKSAGDPAALTAVGGRGQRRGPHPAPRGRIPPSIIHGGESWWRRGERLAVPSRPNRTGTGPAGGIPGGRAGLGTVAPTPGSRECAGRRGRERAGPRAAAGEGGEWKGRAGSGANPERPSGAGRGLPRAAAPGGGGGVAPCPGDDGGPSRGRGGAGRVSPDVGPCHLMTARHGTISPPIRAGVCFGGGGGGWRLLCAPSHVLRGLYTHVDFVA